MTCAKPRDSALNDCHQMVFSSFRRNACAESALVAAAARFNGNPQHRTHTKAAMIPRSVWWGIG